MAVDFEAEGLLEGTEGKAREARLELLRELHEDGVPLEELREAVEEGRLVLLPVERALAGGGRRFTLDEIAAEVGLSGETLSRQRQALGLPVDEEGAGGTEGDLEAARRLRVLLDAGLPEEGLLEVTRVIGVAMSQVAAANRSLIVDALVRPGDTELDVAHRFVAAAQALEPLLGEILAHTLRQHLLEQVRHDMLEGIGSGEPPVRATEITACFADLVGFTRLGERLPVEEIGAVTGRLAELAATAAVGPVRLVKLIGDGALLVAADNDAVMDAALELHAAAEADEELPPLRIGLARGPAVTRAGDWYGPPVNAAARITAAARPGTILVDEAVKDAAAGEYRFSFAGARKLKGMSREHKLFRLRPPG